MRHMFPESRYEPPYDSPIEDAFAWHCHKQIHPDVKCEKQVEVYTQHGLFRVDLDYAIGDEHTAIECDGRDFHDAHRDEFRDAILIGGGHFATVYHFRGCDIVHNPDNCVWLMSLFDPGLFSRRGHRHLNQLQTLNADQVRHRAESSDFSLETQDGHHYHAFRRSVKTRGFWRVMYQFACEYPGAGLDDLLAEFVR